MDDVVKMTDNVSRVGYQQGLAAGIKAALSATGECTTVQMARKAIRALSTPASAETAKHTDRSVPCPTCGFVIRQAERRPLVIEDDNPPLSASAPAGAPSEATKEQIVEIIAESLPGPWTDKHLDGAYVAAHRLMALYRQSNE